jgi:hypothetical protein
MLQNILLIILGFILGILITMIIETTSTVNYLHKLRRAEFEIRQITSKNKKLYDENCELAARVLELKQILKSNGIPDFEDW